MCGDQKCIFWSPNKKLTGRRRKKEGEEEKEEEEEGGGASKGMETKLKYGCLTLVWKLWILACFWYKNYLSMDC